MAAVMAVALVACDPNKKNPPVVEDDLPAFLDKSKTSEMVVTVGGAVVAHDTVITISKFEQDPLGDAGKEYMAELIGMVQHVEGFRVSIHRSAEDLDDQFCAAGDCKYGDGEKDQDLDFVLRNGATEAEWYTHFYPQSNPQQETTIDYVFKNHDKSLKLTVKYVFAQPK